ncbi:MAG: cupredoxin domain-containing protein [Thermomicrobiales bacterium]
MGAVQKLATVVIVGMVALATLLVIYLAAEPSRMAAESVEQHDVAIERGINTFIQNCVVCHGPAGEGYSEPGAKGTGRIGMPLGGDTEAGRAATARNQSADPIERAQRHRVIVQTLQNGRGLMPAFGRGNEGGAILNDEQIEQLALMIQNVDWNLVYNKVIAADGGYPTFPPAPQAAAAPAQTPAPSGQGANAGDVGASDKFTVESHDIFFQPKEITIPSGKEVTLLLPNLGASPHNFSIDALNISVDIAPGETKEVKINAPEGQYEYYCNVPGHKEAGMIGTLFAKPVSAAQTADESAATLEQDQAAAQGEVPAAALAPTVTAIDIAFQPNAVTIPANTDVTFTLPNNGAAPHNFSIDALNISVDLQPGETKTVVINAPAGSYEYYCNVPGHKEAGMVGTLTVTNDGGGTEANAPAAAGTAEAQAATEAPASTEAAAPSTAKVDLIDIAFQPKDLTIPVGKDVTVSLENTGAAPHNFSIDALKISVDVQPGETKDVVINAPAGTYEYYCNVPGHKEAGMVGTLTVTDDGGAAASAPASDTTEAAQTTSEASATAEVTSVDIAFQPNALTIPANTDLTFTLPNTGAAPHNFSIDALNVSVDLQPGETKEVVINAPAGTYEYYCNVPGHKEAGMVGTLTVQ